LTGFFYGDYLALLQIVLTEIHPQYPLFRHYSAFLKVLPVNLTINVTQENSTENISVEERANSGNATLHPAVTIEINEEEKKAYVTIKKTDTYPVYGDVVEALRATGTLYWTDEDAIRKGLDRSVFDKPFVVAFAKEGKLEITIEKHDTAAHLTLHPAYGGRDIILDDVKEKIVQAGIVFGVDYEVVHNVLSEKEYDKPVLFAQCKEPVHGIDGRIEYGFPLEFKMSPKELDHDKVDYKELQLIFAVDKGDAVARKILPTSGEAGCTVTGKAIAAKPGKDVKLSAGRNAVLSDDSCSIISLIEGQPVLKGKTVFVEPVLVIPEDVDYSVGNINFKGSVKISGSIVSGFSVKATENIEIEGVAEDCYIEAGRDVSIKGGVLGAEKGSVKAGRDIHMSFVENCYIEAARNVFVGDVLNSEISAGDTIDVALGKGRVFGGKLSARNLIATNILGSGAAERTQITVGYEPRTVTKLKNLKDVLSRVEYTHEEIKKHIRGLEESKQGAPFPAEKETLLMRLVATEEELGHTMEELKGEIAMLEATMTKAVQPLVKIRKTCHPNVRIKIGRLVLDCYEEYNSAIFYEEEEKIKVNVYESFV
jgi:uncharacterized protein